MAPVLRARVRPIPPTPPELPEARLPPLLPAELNERRDGPALRQLLLHVGLLVTGGILWRGALPPLGGGVLVAVRAAGLVLLGLGLAFAFCAMHECGHRTAFRSRRLNDLVAWWAGVLSFYNADFYRRYHQWHHRWTHLPGKDPELEDPPPNDPGAYALVLSGLPWWIGKLRSHWRGALGDFTGCPYIPPEAAPAVRRSIRLQLAVYGVLLLASLPAGNGLLLWFWLLPLAVGQPVLRFVLLAEHTGCPLVDDPLRNTRTTLTLAPLRLLMWNMPFHAEHHLLPSLPFHALPTAHRLLAPRLEHLERGYLRVHRGLLAHLDALALPPSLAESGASPAP